MLTYLRAIVPGGLLAMLLLTPARSGSPVVESDARSHAVVQASDLAPEERFAGEVEPIISDNHRPQRVPPAVP